MVEGLSSPHTDAKVWVLLSWKPFANERDPLATLGSRCQRFGMSPGMLLSMHGEGFVSSEPKSFHQGPSAWWRRSSGSACALICESS